MNNDHAIEVRKSMEKIIARLFRDYERQFPTELVLNVSVYRQANLLPEFPPIGDVSQIVINTTGGKHG